MILTNKLDYSESRLNLQNNKSILFIKLTFDPYFSILNQNITSRCNYA